MFDDGSVPNIDCFQVVTTRRELLKEIVKLLHQKLFLSCNTVFDF